MMFDNKLFFYRLHPKHIEIDRISLSNELDKQSFYVFSVWDETKRLAQIQQSIKLIQLGNKLLISACSLSFYFQMCNKNLTVRLSTYFGDRLVQIAEGQLYMLYIFKHYQEENQRYYPQFKCSLNFGFGQVVLVFQIYVQKSLYELENYIKELKQFQKQVRNKKFTNYKTIKNGLNEKDQNNIEILHTIKEETSSINKGPERLQYLNEEFDNPEIVVQKQQNQRIGSNHFDEENMPIHDNFNKVSSEHKIKSKQSSQIPMQVHNEPSYLQINSAFVQMNRIKKISNQESSSNNLGEQISKQSLLPSAIGLEASRIFGNHKYEQMQKSTISDGSQYSQMIQQNQKQSHSKKAVKNFYIKLRKFNNIVMILAAIFLIYIVLIPNSHYLKSNASKKKDKRYAHRT